MYHRRTRIIFSTLVIAILVVLASPAAALALQNPQSGTVGLQGTIGSPPPTQPATITSPGNNSSTSSPTTTVSGTCPNGTIVKVFSNGIFIGSVECSGGHFSLTVQLFNGENNITAIDYDALDQSGPNSAAVTVNYVSSQFTGFGPLLFITSSYAKRGADPGQVLTWPITINGGTAPYAISVDWGDGQAPEVISQSFSGVVNLSHTYNNAGTYTIIIRATDKNGETAYFQMIGVANGPISQSNTSKGATTTVVTKTNVVWWPSVVAIPLIIITFWLGRRAELRSLRKKAENQEI
jgi:hypothetical protein